MSELLPCPFCGAAAIESYSESGKEWWVVCGDGNCDIEPLACDRDQQYARKKWNRRAAPEHAAPVCPYIVTNEEGTNYCKLGAPPSVSPQAPTAFPWLPTDLHPATKNLVVQFAGALADKLYAAEKKYGYSDGWMADDWLDECRAKLREHVTKGDPRDVAAYCAFLWHHKASTLFASNVASAAPQGPTAEGTDWVRVPREALLKLKRGHDECEDCWYSCATLTCDDKRKSDVCDCGADEVNKRIDEWLSAAPRPDAGEGLVKRLRETAHDSGYYSIMTEAADALEAARALGREEEKG